MTLPLRRNGASRKPRLDRRSRGSPLQARVSHVNHPHRDPLRVNECRVSVRDVRGSAPRRRSDASLTPCRSRTPRCADVPRCALQAEMKNIRISNLAVTGTSEMSEIRPTCPEFAPRARYSHRVPRFASRAVIRVAKTPSDDEPFHTFSISPPRNAFLSFNPYRDYIYLYILLNTPLVFGQRPPNSICVYF